MAKPMNRRGTYIVLRVNFENGRAFRSYGEYIARLLIAIAFGWFLCAEELKYWKFMLR